MKIRTGFVSNSSSSSFLIAVKNDKCPHCNNGSPFLGLLESLTMAGDNGTRAHNSEQVITDLKNEIKYCQKRINIDNKFEESFKNDIVEYNARIEKINETQKNMEWQVYRLSIDYNDSWLNCLMEDQENKGLLKVIERD